MRLDFASSPRSSIGIEWELQLVDKDSNDLRQAADSVIDVAWRDPRLKPHVHREMLLNTVEVTSGAHQRVEECLADLRYAMEALRPITNGLRADIAAAGSHPFASPSFQRVTNSKRYAELVERTQYWGRQMLLYGVHVHVGVEDRDKVLPIINALATVAGQLQSLSASSPYWNGEDTKYASNRAMVFQQLPTAGIPRQFNTWDELESFTGDMLKTGIIDSFDQVRWDVRPSPGLGTVELRIFDACTNIREVQALASLTHCLVEYYSTLLDEGTELPRLPDWYVAENKWRSARYGMDAILILDAEGTEGHVRDSVISLVETLRPTARRLQCEIGLDYVLEILDAGASYQRQRNVARLAQTDPLKSVAELLRAEMIADRPLSAAEFFTAQREAEPERVVN